MPMFTPDEMHLTEVCENILAIKVGIEDAMLCEFTKGFDAIPNWARSLRMSLKLMQIERDRLIRKIKREKNLPVTE